MRVPVNYIPADKARVNAATGDWCENNKPLTGIIFSLYANGDTALRQPCLKGKENGWVRRWYPGKRLQEERYYVAGKKEGLHRSWWPDGKLRFAYNFTDDEYDGSVEEWYESGQAYRAMHYEKGQEKGMQKMWYFNGKIKANYVVINNRRFGLSGTKNCVTVSDSMVGRP